MVAHLTTALAAAVLPLLAWARPPQELAGYSSINPRGIPLTAYTPLGAQCPVQLVRIASSHGDIGPDEADYVSQRSAKATDSLKSWLSQTHSGFAQADNYPTVAFAASGGGLRAALVAAGVRKGLDARENATAMAGLLQAFTYETGLSGGAWALGSMASNNYPTVSSLVSSLWAKSFSNSLLLPNNLLAVLPILEIVTDLVSKTLAGYPASLVDVYGRLLGFMFINTGNGGVSNTWSGLKELSSFKNFEAPVPLMTAIGSDPSKGSCAPGVDGVQYEFSPFEFGSWDTGVQAFSPSSYMGSQVFEGHPGKCTSRFDNIGLLMGTSSNVFGSLCSVVGPAKSDGALAKTLRGILVGVHQLEAASDFAVFPNPFKGFQQAHNLASFGSLHMLDGGTTGQNLPLWPLLRRNVDVIFATDSTSDVDGIFPGGSSLYRTMEQDRAQGLNRMPDIPPMNDFTAKGLNTHTTFFGCNDPSKVTIIYLPNKHYTYNTGTPQGQLQYSRAAVNGFIDNGLKVASNGDAENYATCVGCAVMKKTGAALPAECTACLEQYCYN